MAEEYEEEEREVEALYTLPEQTYVESLQFPSGPSSSQVLQKQNKHRKGFLYALVTLPSSLKKLLFHASNQATRKVKKRNNGPLRSVDDERYTQKAAPRRYSHDLDDYPARVTAHRPHVSQPEEQLTEAPPEHVMQQYVEQKTVEEVEMQPSKSIPMPRKTAPMSKKAIPRNTKNAIEATSKPDVVQQALAETSKAAPVLHSAAFSETRFAKAWQDWSAAVAVELTEFAKRVQQDSHNGYSWTLFAKVCKFDPSLVANSDVAEPKFVRLTASSSDEPHFIQPVPAVDNGAFSIEQDASLVETFVFTIHPSFIPHIIKQTSPTLTRVGWGSFICKVEVHMKVANGSKIVPMTFDHELLLKPDEVGAYESTYFIDVEGEKFIVQVGNLYGMIDDPSNVISKDEVLSNIAKSRGKRREQLERTKARLEEVRSSQRVIDDFIEACEEKQMALGAVVAAILNGRDMTSASFQALYDHGRKSLRCVVLDAETIPHVERFILGGTALGSDLDAYDVSREASGLGIDRFISHSWFDNAKQKCDTILRWASDFQIKEGRPPRIWCDKFCLKQTSEDLKMSVPCLPIYLLRCDRVLLLRSGTFVSRLWCLTEVYTRYIMGTASAQDTGLEVINLDEVSDVKKTESLHVSIATARCSMKDDEDALRKNFDRAPGGLSEVEKVLNQALS